MATSVAEEGRNITETLSRRSFLRRGLQLLAAGSLGGILAAITSYFYPTDVQEYPLEPVPAGAPEDIPVGTAKTVPFGRYPALVINTQEGLRAYVAVCTHFACIVKWDEAEGVLACPCHEGFFRSDDGSVISGPPPEPLKSLEVIVEDGKLFIGGA